jgi:hypothetical protein
MLHRRPQWCRAAKIRSWDRRKLDVPMATLPGSTAKPI